MKAQWMFDEWPDGTLFRKVQILHTAVARSLAVALAQIERGEVGKLRVENSELHAELRAERDAAREERAKAWQEGYDAGVEDGGHGEPIGGRWNPYLTDAPSPDVGGTAGTVAAIIRAGDHEGGALVAELEAELEAVKKANMLNRLNVLAGIITASRHR